MDLASASNSAFMSTPSTQPEQHMQQYSSGPFSVDEIGFIQIAESKVLAAVARGEIDLNRIAREEMACRGLDQHAKWVGFDKAREIHQV
jgi:hypothetical protein